MFICVIQIELFLPDTLDLPEIYTEIFENLKANLVAELYSVPSLRPPVHIFVDTKANEKEFDFDALAVCTERTSTQTYRGYMVNHVQFMWNFACTTKFDNTQISLECDILNVNFFIVCPEFMPFLFKHFSSC